MYAIDNFAASNLPVEVKVRLAELTNVALDMGMTMYQFLDQFGAGRGKSIECSFANYSVKWLAPVYASRIDRASGEKRRGPRIGKRISYMAIACRYYLDDDTLFITTFKPYHYNPLTMLQYRYRPEREILQKFNEIIKEARESYRICVAEKYRKEHGLEKVWHYE